MSKRKEESITVSAEWWTKFKQIVGIPMEEEYEVIQHGGVATLEAEPAPSPRKTVEKPANHLNQIVGFNSTLTQSEVMIIEPKSFDDALAVVQSLREHRAVIMNMKELSVEQARRLLDFVSGAAHALDGHQNQVGEDIFLFSPSSVVINSLGAEQPWLNRDARDLFWPVKR